MREGDTITTLDGVAEYMEGYPVELRRHRNGRIVLYAENEAGNNAVCIDFLQLVDWIARFPEVIQREDIGGDA